MKDYEDEEGLDEPAWGVYNTPWLLRAVLPTATIGQVWNGLAGLAKFLSALPITAQVPRDEIIDVVVQSMYTGTYVDPFGDSEDPGDPEEMQVTEDDIADFVARIDDLVAKNRDEQEGDDKYD